MSEERKRKSSKFNTCDNNLEILNRLRISKDIAGI